MASIAQLIREAEHATDERNRFLDLCLVLRRAKTRETLLWAGGKWDRIDRRFTETEPEEGTIVDLEESQVEFVTWFATWLRDYREGLPRDVSLALAGGQRRGGKTFALLLCSLAAVIDCPGAIGWAVSRTFSEREELDRTIRQFIPSHWYTYRGAPKFLYSWANGATTQVLSASDYETLKRGRADVVLINEGQKMQVGALVNSIGGTIDSGGISLVAANPPKHVAGEWVNELKEAIDEARLPPCRFFGFLAEGNSKINQAARTRFAQIAAVVDQRSAEADADGEWRPVGDLAYPRFQRRLHVQPPPASVDVTEQLTRSLAGRPYRFVGGLDFQATPHNAGVFVRVYAGADGKPIYHVCGEALIEGTETDFLDSIDDRGLFTSVKDVLWIGDASGTWQDGAHRLHGRVSFDYFKERGYAILPPQRKRTDKGDYPKNPAREDRLSLVNKLLATDRLFIDPTACPQLAVALKKTQLKRGRPVGRFAHETDALGYALWFLEPRPQPLRRPLSVADSWAVPRSPKL